MLYVLSRKPVKYIIIGSENYINEGIVDYFESLSEIFVLDHQKSRKN